MSSLAKRGLNGSRFQDRDLYSIEDFSYYLPTRMIIRIMEEKQCFRTEVRDSGFYICGTHTSASRWAESSDYCPDAVDLAELLDSEIWFLAKELAESSQSNSALRHNLYKDDLYKDNPYKDGPYDDPFFDYDEEDEH